MPAVSAASAPAVCKRVRDDTGGERGSAAGEAEEGGAAGEASDGVDAASERASIRATSSAEMHSVQRPASLAHWLAEYAGRSFDWEQLEHSFRAFGSTGGLFAERAPLWRPMSAAESTCATYRVKSSRRSCPRSEKNMECKR